MARTAGSHPANRSPILLGATGLRGKKIQRASSLGEDALCIFLQARSPTENRTGKGSGTPVSHRQRTARSTPAVERLHSRRAARHKHGEAKPARLREALVDAKPPFGSQG